MRQHPEVPFWLCVGDVADAAGGYEPLDAPLYWIKGNNENFDLVSAPQGLPSNLHYVPNAQLIDTPPVGQSARGLRVAGLGGTFAPTWYDTAAAELPYPALRHLPDGRESRREPTRTIKVKDDKRRHFVREEVDTCKAMLGVDVFLSHEAPRPFKVGPVDAGKTPINEVLASMKPRLHLFGHHHRFSDRRVQGVRSVGLDLVSRSYILIDVETLEALKLP